MGRITLYGIPSQVGDWARSVLSGSVGETLWKLFVVVLVLSLAVLLIATTGAVGAAIGTVILFSLLIDDVRELMSNLWNRNWAEMEAPW